MHPQSLGVLRVRPAPWTRRLCALLLDYLLIGAVLALVAAFLPEGPPPVDAMAFFSGQDFINYFCLVGLALVLVNATFLPVVHKAFRATPAQLLLGLRLRSLNDSEPEGSQVRIRWAKAMQHAVFVTVPGPLIALIVGALVGALFDIPFSTADEVLRQAGLPAPVRHGLHGLSFLALFAALWHHVARPNIEASEQEAKGLTALDKTSGTTHVVKTHA